MASKKYNPIKNLKHYAHPAKLPTKGKKIGATLLKLSNKSKLGPATVKTSRRKMKRMQTPKGI
jgi:hypothetical protein